MAYDIIEKTYDKYDKIIMYFMSDGGCSFPQAAINLFNNNPSFKTKIDFYSIAFGSGADSNLLKRISDQMPNGNISIAFDAAALNKTFS